MIFCVGLLLICFAAGGFFLGYTAGYRGGRDTTRKALTAQWDEERRTLEETIVRLDDEKRWDGV